MLVTTMILGWSTAAAAGLVGIMIHSVIVSVKERQLARVEA